MSIKTKVPSLRFQQSWMGEERCIHTFAKCICAKWIYQNRCIVYIRKCLNAITVKYKAKNIFLRFTIWILITGLSWLHRPPQYFYDGYSLSSNHSPPLNIITTPSPSFSSYYKGYKSSFPPSVTPPPHSPLTINATTLLFLIVLLSLLLIPLLLLLLVPFSK